MAKVSEQAREIYQTNIAEYKKTIKDLQSKEQTILQSMNPQTEQANYKKLVLADLNTNLASYYAIMNTLSISHLGVKNEPALNDGRKLCYKSVIYLEDIFTDLIDTSYIDYEQGVLSVADYPEFDKYKIIRKLGFAINQIETAFGENSKWKWSFVELNGRLTTVCKNCINLKKLIPGMDPRVDGYAERISHFKLTKKLLEKSADEYRLKYELSTARMDDFKQAINYLSALKRLLSVNNRPKEVEDLKKKIDIWKIKMDKDLKAREKKAQMDKMNKR